MSRRIRGRMTGESCAPLTLLTPSHHTSPGKGGGRLTQRMWDRMMMEFSWASHTLLSPSRLSARITITYTHTEFIYDFITKLLFYTFLTELLMFLFLIFTFKRFKMRYVKILISILLTVLTFTLRKYFISPYLNNDLILRNILLHTFYIQTLYNIS